MSQRALGIASVVVLLLSFAIGAYVYRGSSSPAARAASGFDIGADRPDLVASEARAPAAPRPEAIRSSPHPRVGYEDEDDEYEDGPPQSYAAGGPAQGGAAVPPGAAGGPAASAAAPAGASSPSDEDTPAAQRAHEKDFLAKHAQELYKYHVQLNNIAMRYYKNNPVVRDVDQAFARMGNYMAVKKRFDKDRDPFAFARDAIALPEVRAEIAKRMTDPAVWGAALGMITEALKQPPPDALYKEAQNFLTADDKMSSYISTFGGDVAKNVGALTQGIPPGADLSGLKKVVMDVSPGSLPSGVPPK